MKYFHTFLIILFLIAGYGCGTRQMSPEQELYYLEAQEDELEEAEEIYIDAALTYLENLLYNYPYNPFGADASLRLAELYRIKSKSEYTLQMKKWEEAGMPIGQEPIIDYFKAKQMYLTVINEYEGLDTLVAADAYYMLASVLEEEGNIDSASILYRKLVERFPRNSRVPSSSFRLGLYYFNFRHEGFGKVDLALDYFDKVLEFPNDPNYDKAIYMIGWLNRLAGEDSLMASMTYFLFLLELAESEGRTQLADEAVMYLGFNFSELPDGPSRAQRVLSRLSELPYGPDILIKLAETYVDKIEYNKAIETYNSFIDLYPNNPRSPFILRDIAALYAEVGDIAMAEASMDRLVEIYGSGDWMMSDTSLSSNGVNTDSLIREAMLYTAGIHHRKALEDGSIDEWRTAAERYNNFLDKFPEDPESYGIRFAFAEALYELGNFNKAGSEYTKVAFDSSGDTLTMTAAYEAVTSFHQWYLMDSTSSERVDTLMSASERYINLWDVNPGDSTSHPVNISMTAGKVLYETSKYNEARVWYEYVVENFVTSPATPTAAVMVAQCHYQSEEYALAEQWFNKAASMSGDTSLTQQAASVAFQSASDASDDDTLKAVDFLVVFQNYPDRQEGKKALFNAGVIFNNAGNDERALEVFKKFTDYYNYVEDSLLYSAYINIANISLDRAEKAQEQGITDRYLWIEAASALEEISLRYPQTQEGREAVLWSGRAYLGAGDYSSARISFQRVIDNTSFSEAIYYEALHKLAISLDSLGLNADALNIRRIVLRDYFEGGQAAGISPVDIDKDMLEVLYSEFIKIKGTLLYWPINSSFPPYDQDMKNIAGKLTSIASLKSGVVTVASLYLLGQCNEDYARAFREAEYDPNWTEEEQLYFQDELEMQALPYEDVAAQFYKAAKETAENNNYTDNEWFRKNLQAVENLKIFRPDLFPEDIIYEEVLEDSINVDSLNTVDTLDTDE